MVRVRVRQRPFVFVIVFSAVLIIIACLYKVFTLSRSYNTLTENDIRKFSHFSVPIGLIRMVKQVASTGIVPVVAMVNSAFLPFTHSFLCNTETMDVHQHFILITTDSAAFMEISQRWPRVKVYHFIMIEELKSIYEWDDAGYWLITFMRAKLLEILLKQNIPFMNIEVDCVWIRNPLNIVSKFSGYDIITAQLGGQLWNENYTAGFIYFNATRPALLLWQEMLNRLQINIQKVMEQDAIDELCKAGFAGVKCTLFPYSKIADGMYYHRSLVERRSTSADPCLINNNYIIGLKNKVLRAKLYQHWFLEESFKESSRCNASNVREIVKHEIC